MRMCEAAKPFPTVAKNVGVLPLVLIAALSGCSGGDLGKVSGVWISDSDGHKLEITDWTYARKPVTVLDSGGDWVIIQFKVPTSPTSSSQVDAQAKVELLEGDRLQVTHDQGSATFHRDR